MKKTLIELLEEINNRPITLKTKVIYDGDGKKVIIPYSDEETDKWNMGR